MSPVFLIFRIHSFYINFDFLIIFPNTDFRLFFIFVDIAKEVGGVHFVFFALLFGPQKLFFNKVLDV